MKDLAINHTRQRAEMQRISQELLQPSRMVFVERCRFFCILATRCANDENDEHGFSYELLQRGWCAKMVSHAYMRISVYRVRVVSP